MRIIIKPLGFLVLGFVAIAGIAIPSLKRGGQAAPSLLGTLSGDHRENLAQPEGWQAYGTAGGEQNSQALTSLPAGVSNAQSVHIETKKFTNEPWAIGYTQTLIAEFVDKETVTLSFWARSHESQHLRIAMQFASHNYHECWNKEAEITPEWKEYRYIFQTEAFKSKEGSLAFQTGFRVGWVELAGITLRRGSR